MILDASYKHCNMTADVPARTSPLFWVHDHIPQISCSLLAQTSAPWTSSGGIATACHERSCESLWIWVFLAVRCLHFRDGWCLKCHAVMQETAETATKIREFSKSSKGLRPRGADRHSITRHDAGGLQLSMLAANHESGTPTAAIQMQLGSLQRKIYWCSWRVSSRWWSLFTLNHEAKIGKNFAENQCSWKQEGDLARLHMLKFWATLFQIVSEEKSRSSNQESNNSNKWRTGTHLTHLCPFLKQLSGCDYHL